MPCSGTTYDSAQNTLGVCQVEYLCELHAGFMVYWHSLKQADQSGEVYQTLLLALEFSRLGGEEGPASPRSPPLQDAEGHPQDTP